METVLIILSIMIGLLLMLVTRKLRDKSIMLWIGGGLLLGLISIKFLYPDTFSLHKFIILLVLIAIPIADFVLKKINTKR